MMPRSARLGALQIGSSLDGTVATVEAIQAYAEELADARLDLLGLPEALLGGYPKGADFGARMGYRTADGRDAYHHYWHQAVALDGPEVGALRSLADQTGTAIVVGVIERDRASLYCTAVFVTASGELAGRHPKLMPTATERLVRVQSANLELTTMDTAAGRAGAAICWENYMPLYRDALYGQGVEVWCAPTVD